MKQLLFVCTGNICRSPIGAGLMQKALAERGLDGVEVASAGTYALVGQPAEQKAQEVMKSLGVDLSGHRARMLTEELIQWADLILVMEPKHRDVVEAMVPEAAEKVRLLAAYGPPGDPERAVPDPYGGSTFHYRACAVEISEALNSFLAAEGGTLGG